MANYSDLGQVALQADFQKRVRTALFSAAVAAYNESAQTVGHAARAAYAIKVLAGQYDINSVSQAVLTNATIAAEATADGSKANNQIPDADVQFSMNSIYNGLAGV